MGSWTFPVMSFFPHGIAHTSILALDLSNDVIVHAVSTLFLILPNAIPRNISPSGYDEIPLCYYVTVAHPPFRICHRIVLIPTYSSMTFPGEASHTYFFRRKVSASRILQVPDALFPEFFQKLFAVCSSQ